jgi:nicotinate-nucleotide adenylyltransferase
LKIGLFGGTFDPPHRAHLAASLLAMKRIGLDRVWWLVTPGNPLKDTRHLDSLERRVAAVRALTQHPRIDVSAIEAQIGTRYTYDTIAYILSRCRDVHFVWIMGADNLRGFHRWQKWRAIAAMIPFAVVDRLGPSLYAGASVAGQALARRRGPCLIGRHRRGSFYTGSNRRSPRPPCGPGASHETGIPRAYIGGRVGLWLISVNQLRIS